MRVLRYRSLMRLAGTALPAAALLLLAGTAQADQVVSRKVSSSFTPSAASLSSAKPWKLPQLNRAQMLSLGFLNPDGSLATPARNTSASTSTSRQTSGTVSLGNVGGPTLEPVQLIPQSSSPAPQKSVGGGTVAPMDYGDAEWPFTTARVQLYSKQVTSAAYPYRAAGKLMITLADGSTGWCSAALIRKGLLVTAAHCVADYGVDWLNATWTFYPGLYNGKGAYGGTKAVEVFALNSYVNGSNPCTVAGVVCLDDVAVVVLASKSGKYVGSRTGWLGYKTRNWGFTPTYGQTQITQLGYPHGIEYGNQMIRTDSQGQAWYVTKAFNTLIGSLMDGGSSGGPWINNFGMQPLLTDVIPGYAPDPNMIVGVTSWGYTDHGALAVQGASPFRPENIDALVNTACYYYPSACAP